MDACFGMRGHVVSNKIALEVYLSTSPDFHVTISIIETHFEAQNHG